MVLKIPFGPFQLVIGTPFNDDINTVGDNKRNIIFALNGSDYIRSGARNDIIFGDKSLLDKGMPGDDTIFAGAGDD